MNHLFYQRAVTAVYPYSRVWPMRQAKKGCDNSYHLEYLAIVIPRNRLWLATRDCIVIDATSSLLWEFIAGDFSDAHDVMRSMIIPASTPFCVASEF